MHPHVDGYALLARLGHGSMGAVYRARQAGADADVCLKLAFGGDGPAAERLRLEARRRHDVPPHDNVVTVFADGETDAGVPYLVQELVDGLDLQRVHTDARSRGDVPAVLPHGRLPAAVVVYVAGEVLRGLAHLHQHQVVHRDVKPSNLLVSWAGDVKVCDLGVAKGDGDDADLTQCGEAIGTKAYCAPEQHQRGGPVGPQADVFALGVVVFEALLGRWPFRGLARDCDANVLAAKLAGPTVVLAAARPDLPPAVAACFHALLTPDAARRPDAFGALVALRAALAADPPPPGPDAARKAGREALARVMAELRPPPRRAAVPPVLPVRRSDGPVVVTVPSTAARPARFGRTVVVGAGVLAMLLGASWLLRRTGGAHALPPPRGAVGLRTPGDGAARPAPPPASPPPAPAVVSVVPAAPGVAPPDAGAVPDAGARSVAKGWLTVTIDPFGDLVVGHAQRLRERHFWQEELPVGSHVVRVSGGGLPSGQTVRCRAVVRAGAVTPVSIQTGRPLMAPGPEGEDSTTIHAPRGGTGRAMPLCNLVH